MTRRLQASLLGAVAQMHREVKRNPRKNRGALLVADVADEAQRGNLQLADSARARGQRCRVDDDRQHTGDPDLQPQGLEEREVAHAVILLLDRAHTHVAPIRPTDADLDRSLRQGAAGEEESNLLEVDPLAVGEEGDLAEGVGGGDGAVLASAVAVELHDQGPTGVGLQNRLRSGVRHRGVTVRSESDE